LTVIVRNIIQISGDEDDSSVVKVIGRYGKKRG